MNVVKPIKVVDTACSGVARGGPGDSGHRAAPSRDGNLLNKVNFESSLKILTLLYSF